MTILSKFINYLYFIIRIGLYIVLIWALFYIGKSSYKSVKEYIKQMINQEAQLNELYKNDAYLQTLIERNSILDEQVLQAIIIDFENLHHKINRPTYNLLTSMTVYMFKMSNQTTDFYKGYVGTGIIVAIKNKYFYILTNKHICDKTKLDNCFILMNKGLVKLDFVKQTESKYDLALWRTNIFLPNKTAIKGVKFANIQDNVYSVGNYLSSPFMYTEGTISGIMNDFLVANLPCADGCSGSGLFNQEGYLVGLMFAINRIGLGNADTTKVLAINADIIKLFLKDLI